MNGKTHQISGVAATLTTTFLTIEFHSWIVSNLPGFITPLLTPPAALLTPVSISIPVEATGNLVGGAGAGLEAGTTLLILAGIAFVGVVAGQLPDLDTPYSTVSNGGTAIGRWVRGRGILGLLLKLFFGLVNLIPRSISLVANHLMGGHRNGIIHGFLGWFGFSLVAGWLSQLVLGTPFVGLLVFVAYFTHLLVDSFSRSGVKWLWPLVDREFHALPKALCFRTANPLHNALAQVVFIGLTGWVGFGLFNDLTLSPVTQGTGVVSITNGSLDGNSGGSSGSGTVSSSLFSSLNVLNALGQGGTSAIAATIALILTGLLVVSAIVAGLVAYPDYQREKAMQGGSQSGMGSSSSERQQSSSF